MDALERRLGIIGSTQELEVKFIDVISVLNGK